MASKRITRRDFIKTTSASALAGSARLYCTTARRRHRQEDPEDYPVGALRPSLRQVVQ